MRVTARGPGDEFDGTALDTTKFERDRRATTPTKYAVADGDAEGHDRPRRHLHQRRSVRDAATAPADGRPRRDGLRRSRRRSTSRARRRLRPGRHPGPRHRRRLREVRRDLRRRATRRSTGSSCARRSGGTIQNPRHRIRLVPGRHAEHLAAADQGRARRTRASTRSTATTWTALSAHGHQHADRRRGSASSRWACSRPATRSAFDYFKVDGSTGCPGQEPENKAPVIAAATATPTIGFAPLPVQFAVDGVRRRRRRADLQLGLRRRRHRGRRRPRNASHTYTTAGTYNAKVTVSDGEDTASPDGRRSRCCRPTTRGAVPGARLLQDDGLPARLDPGGHRGDQASSATENNFQVDATEDAAACSATPSLAHYDTVVFLSTTGDPLNDTQQAAFERYIRGGGGYTGIHAAADTEYDVDLVRQAGGRVLPQPPARNADRDGARRGHRSPLHRGHPEPVAARGRVVQLPVARARAPPAAPTTARAPAASTCSRRSTSRPTTRRTATRRMTTIRSRGASATTAAARGTRAWATRRRRSPRPTSSSTCSAASRSRRARCDDAACGEHRRARADTVQAFADPATGPGAADGEPHGVRRSIPTAATLTYEWTFSDGRHAPSARRVNRTYAQPGTYTATVKATDGKGETASEDGDDHRRRRAAPPVIVEAGADRTSGPAPLDVAGSTRWRRRPGRRQRSPTAGSSVTAGTALGDEAEHTYLSRAPTPRR